MRASDCDARRKHVDCGKDAVGASFRHRQQLPSAWRRCVRPPHHDGGFRERPCGAVEPRPFFPDARRRSRRRHRTGEVPSDADIPLAARTVVEMRLLRSVRIPLRLRRGAGRGACRASRPADLRRFRHPVIAKPRLKSKVCRLRPGGFPRAYEACTGGFAALRLPSRLRPAATRVANYKPTMPQLMGNHMAMSTTMTTAGKSPGAIECLVFQ